MFCEACGIKGLDKKNMVLDPDTQLFVGPCCAGLKEVVVGIEVSSKKGLKAFLKYNGLKIEYEKPFNELPVTNERNWPEGMPIGEA